MSMSQLTGSLHLGQHLAAAVPHRGKTWLLVLAINALMTLGMSVVLVWLSIDRVNTAYFIDVQRSELKDKQSLRAKLEVERDRLLSPYELRLKADQYGMKEPRPGQIRRMRQPVVLKKIFDRTGEFREKIWRFSGGQIRGVCSPHSGPPRPDPWSGGEPLLATPA